MTFKDIVLAVVFVAGFVVSSGCATRPTGDVLQPVTLTSPVAQPVSILVSTNRQLDKAHGGAMGKPMGSRSNALTFARYSLSVPTAKRTNRISYPTKKSDPQRHYVVTQREDLHEGAFIAKVNDQANADGTVVVFVHGYNFTYQEALFRTAQLAADAGALTPPILFSWPSAARVAGYVADRDMALASRTELAVLLAAISKARKARHIVLFAHSMGSLLAMEAVRQLKLEGRDDVIGELQIVLAAADIDVDLFYSQLRDIGPLPIPIVLLVSKEDRVLSLSSLLGQERPRVGQIDAGILAKTRQTEHVRLVDITSLQSSDGMGHDRYVSLARHMGKAAAQGWQGQVASVTCVASSLACLLN